MALNPSRRNFSLALAGLGVGLATSGCSQHGAVHRSAFVAKNHDIDPSKETILVLLPAEERVEPLVESLARELLMDFNVLFETVTPRSSEWDIEGFISTFDPQLVVLLNNPTVQLYASWAKKKRSHPPSLILMSSFAGELIQTVPSSTAISWEVPIATSVQGLRGLGLDVHRVGVLHRKAFSRQIAQERELARPEKAEFVIQQLDDRPSVRQLKAAIVRTRRNGVDALWIPNDNGLLRPEFLTQVWVPYLRYFNAPVIVGVPALVRADVRLGSYATSPDLTSLGVQAADRIFDIADAGWRLSPTSRAEVPLSVKTYLSIRAVRDFQIAEDKLASIDFLVDENGEALK